MAARHILSRITVLAAFVLVLGGCIYPFEPDLDSSVDRIVVEGDIHIGGQTQVVISHVTPLQRSSSGWLTTYGSSGYYSDLSFAEHYDGYIEGEDGTRVEASGNAFGVNGILNFDTSALPDTQRYRLHLSTSSGAIYETDWLEVLSAPSIDELSYIPDHDRDELNIALSMHCQGHSHFRWTYDETWEYHALLYAYYYYDEDTGTVQAHDIDHPNNYWCWRSRTSPAIKIFSTAEQIEDRFVDLEFHRIARSDERLQVLYRITVHLEALSEDAYRYWNNLVNTSQGQGTIFSPTPSEMVGNIRCLSDPSVGVTGYINCARQADAVLYYDNSIERFYVAPKTGDIELLDDLGETWGSMDLRQIWDLLLRRNYLPYTLQADELSLSTYYIWAPRACLDCRYSGGTRTRPADWPNNH